MTTSKTSRHCPALAGLVLLLICCPAFAQTAPTVSDMIPHLQVLSAADDRVGLIWWMPTEFWEVIFESEGASSDPETQELLAVLRPLIILAAVDGKLGPMGGAHFIEGKDLLASIEVIGDDGKTLRPLGVNEVDPDVRNLIEVMKPALAGVIGPMGENMHFAVFSGLDEDGEPVVTAREHGFFRVKMGEELYEWRLPIAAFFPRKICPVDGERLSGVWTYCPWHGGELRNAAVAVDVIDGRVHTARARGWLELAAARYQAGDFTAAVDGVIEAVDADAGLSTLSTSFLYSTLEAFDDNVEGDFDRAALGERLRASPRDGAASGPEGLGLLLALRAAGATDDALALARELASSTTTAPTLADTARVLACDLRPARVEVERVAPRAVQGKELELSEGLQLGEGVTGEVLAPVKILAPRPRYPESARRARTQGQVIVRTIIDKEGCVTVVEVLKGVAEELDRSAMEAMRRWVFRPATVDGAPVDVHYNLTVNFRLEESAG